MSGRMSRSTFMQAMRELNFQGDAKLVWAWSPSMGHGIPICCVIVTGTGHAESGCPRLH